MTFRFPVLDGGNGGTRDLRVAILTPHDGRRVYGGVEVFNENLRRALGEVEIFADGMGITGAFGDLRRVGLEQPVGAFRAARALLRRHREEPFDLIVSNGVYGWPLTLSRPRVPLIQVYHFTMAGLARNALSHPGSKWTTGHVAAFFDRAAGFGKHVVTVSDKVLREVETLYRHRGRCIPVAVDTDVFRPMDPSRARESLGIPEAAPMGMFVGRPDPSKGYDVLLGIARRMPDVRFLAVGGIPGEVGNVVPIPHIPHAEMPRWYAACDFFVLPSRYEGFGLAVVEALSCDLPVVVSPAAWPFPEDPTECGAVVGSGREEDYVETIRSVLASRTLLSPREFVTPRLNVQAFGKSWSRLVENAVSVGG